MAVSYIISAEADNKQGSMDKIRRAMKETGRVFWELSLGKPLLMWDFSDTVKRQVHEKLGIGLGWASQGRE